MTAVSSASRPHRPRHVITRRVLLYGMLTLTVVLLYIVAVIVLQAVVRAVTGQSSDLAIVLSTLGIATIVNPLRKRLQRVIDRHI